MILNATVQITGLDPSYRSFYLHRFSTHSCIVDDLAFTHRLLGLDIEQSWRIIAFCVACCFH